MIEQIIAYSSFFLYTGSLFFITYYCVNQIYLLTCYFKTKKAPPEDSEYFPEVTIQLPVYNEGELVFDLIDCVTDIDYPKEKLQIQVLDDSTDSTLEYSRQKVEEYKQKGFNIELRNRTDRSGFKAGALSEGLEWSTGEFIAIFDTDFRPNTDFLKALLPEFLNEKVGVVQAKWGHINRDHSLLTKLQAFQLDVHFTVEQKGRQLGNLLLQFNGTCGIWRRKVIDDAGGWDGDTLTEDLDLSYRAQMKGWNIVYREDYEVPGLLPYNMRSLKSQQFRWMKGGAENAIKHFKNVTQSDLTFKQKYFALHHLLASYVFLAILTAAVCSLPFSIYYNDIMIPAVIKDTFLMIFLIPIFVTIAIYFIAHHKQVKFHSFVIRFIQFLSLSMGMSLHNSKGVWEAIIRKRTEFVRTPKENKTYEKVESSIVLKHLKKHPSILAEAFLGLYFLAALCFSVFNQQIFMSLYYTLLSFGFTSIFFYSVLQFKKVD